MQLLGYAIPVDFGTASGADYWFKIRGSGVSPLGSPQGAKFVLWPVFFRVDTESGSACWKVEKFVLGRFFFS